MNPMASTHLSSETEGSGPQLSEWGGRSESKMEKRKYEKGFGEEEVLRR